MGIDAQDLGLIWLGLQDYELALSFQLEAADEVRAGQVARVIACEHESVITLGKRALALNDLLVSLDQLREKKIKIMGTDRGGQATFHNPGQLVVYPILPLKHWNLGVKDYVECLERTTAYFLADRGLDVTRAYEPGLWVNGKKIAAFGIRVDRGVSLHGVAINIFNSLESFSLIRQCGASVKATNMALEMAEFGPVPVEWNLENEARRWLEIFKNELAAIPFQKTESVEKVAVCAPAKNPESIL
jgi:lipoyl(octanoyl) transferase